LLSGVFVLFSVLLFFFSVRILNVLTYSNHYAIAENHSNRYLIGINIFLL
jgi:hypothetical protein